MILIFNPGVMKKILLIMLSLMLLVSCGSDVTDSDGELTAEGFMSTYTRENRGVDLSDM